MNFIYVKAGLALAMLGLVFGLGLGVSFGINEDGFKTYISEGIAASPQVHDAKSQDKIWRYVQRAHFHAMGIAAVSIGLIILVMLSNMVARFKFISSLLIGLGAFYPVAWFTMFILAPGLGRHQVHAHFLTELFTYVGVGGLVLGTVILLLNMFVGCFK